MTLDKTHLVLICAALALVALVGGIALYEHDQKLQQMAVADAKQQAADAFQKQLDAVNASIDAKLKARDDQYATDTKTLNDEFAAAQKSNAQMAALITQLAKLPVPITVSTPAPTAANPNPSPIVTVPQVDFPAVTAYAQSCEQAKLDNTKCQADIADRQAQMANAQKQIDNLKGEVQTWQTAAKGGTTLQRTLRVIKWLAIGGAAGYVAGRKF